VIEHHNSIGPGLAPLAWPGPFLAFRSKTLQSNFMKRSSGIPAATKTIIQKNDPVLHLKAKAISPKDIGSPDLSKLIGKMKALLTKEKFGVGLAAPQVGVPLRLFIVAGRAFLPESDDDEKAELPTPAPDMVFINPEIIRMSRTKKEMTEGCLSVRGYYGAVLRNERASVRALDEKGKSFTYHGSGLVAHIFQHEIDHLEGILYTDKAVRIVTEKERDELRKKAAKKSA
jgi:peptide deformylase